MTNLIVHGGVPISGTVKPSGNKNAVLPMLCASLLSDEKITLTNVPEITDVQKISEYFSSLGSEVDWDKSAETITVTHSDIQVSGTMLPTGIRSSVLLIAPMLRRVGKLRFDTSSRGCTLGLREIDPHLYIVQEFGAELRGHHPYELALDTRESAEVWADYASVTATETFIMMAVLARGTSVLNNAASEPHIQEFCNFLNMLGAQIEGIGTSRLTIHGVESLAGGEYRVPDDHHEVATFLAIGGVSGGTLRVETTIVPHMELIIRQLEKLGLEITKEADALTVTGWNRKIKAPLTAEMLQKIEAAPWPYFPVDLLPQMIAIAAGAEGDILFWNKIYEGAMSWASDLSNFGVKTHLSDPHRLIVFGGNDLRPASVQAPYIIRVVVALFIVAIQIDGKSKIRDADPITRAHPHFISRLQDLGARVEWEE